MNRKVPRVRALIAEDDFSAVDVGVEKSAAQIGQKHLVLGSIQETQKLPRLDDGDRVAEIVFGELIELEDVDLAAVIADDLQKSKDVPESDGGERRRFGDAAGRGQGDRRRLRKVRHLLFRNDVVQSLHHSQECGRLVFARMRHVVGNDGADAARPGAHDHDAIGEKHRLFDQVRYHHHALERERELAAPGPKSIHLAAKALGGENVQGAEGFIHAEQFGPAPGPGRCRRAASFLRTVPWGRPLQSLPVPPRRCSGERDRWRWRGRDPVR